MLSHLQPTEVFWVLFLFLLIFPDLQFKKKKIKLVAHIFKKSRVSLAPTDSQRLSVIHKLSQNAAHIHLGVTVSRRGAAAVPRPALPAHYHPTAYNACSGIPQFC